MVAFLQQNGKLGSPTPLESPEKSPSAGELLRVFQLLFPHYGNSFYAKGKVIKGELPPNPSRVTVDIIRQCSLGCTFCFASDTRRRGDWTPLETLADLFENLKGIEKLALIGGEPFEHPDIFEVVRLAGETASREVEIFTNGLAIPPETNAAVSWLEHLRNGFKAPVLRLTLAVDRWHRERLGPEALAKRISVLLELERRGLVTAMFNVTDPAVHTRDYLDFPVIREVLHSLSPELDARFMERLRQRRVEDSFYLNPLIAQGSQELFENVEPLRAVDFLFNPEIAVTWRNGRHHWFSSLNALWIPRPPAALVLGTSPDGRVAGMFLENVVGRWLGFAKTPGLRESFLALLHAGAIRARFIEKARTFCGKDREGRFLETLLFAIERGEETAVRERFQSVPALRRFERMLMAPDAFFHERACKVLEISDGMAAEGAVMDLAGRPDFDLLRLPVLRAIVGEMKTRGRDPFAEARNLWVRLRSEEGRGRLGLGFARSRVRRQWRPFDPPLSLVETAWRNDFRESEDAGAEYEARPYLRIQEGRILYGIEGLVFEETEEARKEFSAEVERLLEYWRRMFGPLAEELFATLRTEDENGWEGELNRLIEAATETPREGPLPDPVRMLEYAAFDANRNRAPTDNLAFLDELKILPELEALPEKQRKDFLARVENWREHEIMEREMERRR